MASSSPTCPRSPHATYGGDAAAVGQSRLGQALPGERSSLRAKWSVPQQPRTSSPRPAAHTPSFPLIPDAEPCNSRRETRAHPGACMRPMMAATKQQKESEECESFRKPPSTQEMTSHVPASWPAGGGVTLRGPRRPPNYISRNAFQRGSHFLNQQNYTSRHASALEEARG